MADNNKDLPLVVAEILIGMQEMQRDFKEEMQAMRRENMENNDRLITTMSKLIGTLTEHVVDIRQNVKSIDQRLEKVEQKVDDFTDFERRLRTLEDIVLRKAS